MAYIISALAGLGLLMLDQWVKYYISKTLAFGAARPLLPGIVELYAVRNYGAAWSTFEGMRWFLIFFTGGIMLALVVLLVRRIIRQPLEIFGGFLILSGGLGNALDRLRLGYVIDMFRLEFIDYPIFNVADMCIVTGTALITIYYLFFLKDSDSENNGDNERGERHADAGLSDQSH